MKHKDGVTPIQDSLSLLFFFLCFSNSSKAIVKKSLVLFLGQIVELFKSYLLFLNMILQVI